jgi:hypothetical protein
VVDLRHARSFLGKSVNLHLAEGTVLVNVDLMGIEDKLLLVRGNKRNARMQYVALSEVSEIKDVPLETKLLQSKEVA